MAVNNNKNKFMISPFEKGWGGSFFATQYVSGYSYNDVAQIVYIIYPQEQFDIYLQPASIPYSLSIAAQRPSVNAGINADSLYTQAIEGILPQCLLCENGSPLITENGNYYLVLT